MRRSLFVIAATLYSLVFSSAPLAAQQGSRTAASVLERILLSDGDFSALARPEAIALACGSIVVADGSDKDVKLYGRAGARRATVGRAGSGPGEFNSLRGLVSSGDTILAYDFASQSVSRLLCDGRFVGRTRLTSAPFEIRPLNDSLVLHIRHPGQRKPLLAIATKDGRVVREFFERPWLNRYPALRAHTAVFADARGDRIHAAVFGEDSVFTFDLTGRVTNAIQLPGLGSIVTAWEAANGQLQKANGDWFHSGLVAAMSLVALESNRALVMFAPYDTKLGTDLYAGGDAFVMEQRSPPRRLRLTGRPFLSDEAGNLLLVSYSTDAESFQLERWRLP